MATSLTSTTLPTRYGSCLLFLIFSLLSLIASCILERSWLSRMDSDRMICRSERESARLHDEGRGGTGGNAGERCGIGGMERTLTSLSSMRQRVRISSGEAARISAGMASSSVSIAISAFGAVLVDALAVAALFSPVLLSRGGSVGGSALSIPPNRCVVSQKANATFQLSLSSSRCSATNAGGTMTPSLRPTLQLTLSLLLAFAILLFPRWIDEINNPLALASTILVVIVSHGSSVGSTVRNSLSSLCGLLAGIAAFVVLAKIPSPVAQGAVWTVFVAIIAFVRSFGLRFRPFFLVAVLFAFQGSVLCSLVYEFRSPRSSSDYLTRRIYTTTPLRSLLAFVKSYALGIAIPFVCNLVFPVTSHHNLHVEIVHGLENISSLAHLILKSFSKQIDLEEIQLRDHLTLAIRDDFLRLSVCLEETTMEVSYSRMSAQENRDAVNLIRGMQQVSTPSTLTNHTSSCVVGTHHSIKYPQYPLRLLPHRPRFDIHQFSTRRRFAD